MTGKIMALCPDSNGYLKVMIRKGERSMTQNVHKLVYETFVGDVPDNLCIDHDDFDKNNNKPDNLVVMTIAQNSSKGDGKCRRGRKGMVGRLHGAEMVQMHNDKIRMIDIAAKFKCSSSYVEKIIGRARRVNPDEVHTTGGIDFKKMLKMESFGYSYQEIGEAIGTTETYVKQQCAIKRGESPRYRIMQKDVDQIKKMYASGGKMVDIAADFNVSACYVSQILSGKRKNGKI